MKAYRYNTKERKDRVFNNCGKEKNPNNIKFYANNLKYAEKYKDIYNKDGYFLYECELEVVDIPEVYLFDMDINFLNLNTTKEYIKKDIDKVLNDYKEYLENSKNKKERAMWEKNIKSLENRENEIISFLRNTEFQPLSDFEIQNKLVAELKSLGYYGYTTSNEIALF